MKSHRLAIALLALFMAVGIFVFHNKADKAKGYFFTNTPATTAPPANLAQVKTLQALLGANDLNGFIESVQKDSLVMLSIPSAWHVEHVSPSEQKPADTAARALGKTLVLKLADMGPVMQKLPSDESLYQQTVHLLDLSEWCASTDGYGNLFLAQRALDLAAVGIARLTVNLDFPMKKIDPLVARLSPSWMSAETRARILNEEVGANIFVDQTRMGLQNSWGTGAIEESVEKNPSAIPILLQLGMNYTPTKSTLIKNNIKFFSSVDYSQIRLFTLESLWDVKLHERIVLGLDLQSVDKAESIAEFRNDIGYFPEKPVYSEAELKDRQNGINLAKKLNIKVVNTEDVYSSLRAAAFDLTWKSYLIRQYGDVTKLTIAKYNLSTSAYLAYSEVMSGTFLDRDSESISMYHPATSSSPSNSSPTPAP